MTSAIFSSWNKMLPNKDESTEAQISKAAFLAWCDGRGTFGIAKSLRKILKRPDITEKQTIDMIEKERRERDDE